MRISSTRRSWCHGAHYILMDGTQEWKEEAMLFCPHGRRVFDFDGSYGNLILTPLATYRGERPQTPFNRTVAFISCKSCNCLSMPEPFVP